MDIEFSLGQFPVHPIPNPNNQSRKMDIVFYDSIQHLQKRYNLLAIFHFLKALMFIIFIPIDYTVVNSETKSGQILAAMIVALIASLIQGISILVFRCVLLRDNDRLLMLADVLGHLSEQPLNEGQQKLQDCVSTVLYNKQGNILASSPLLTPQLKKMYTTYLSTNLKDYLLKTSYCINHLDNIAEFVGFTSFLFAIISLGKYEENEPQLAILIIFIVTEGLSKIIVILILILLLISPLICIILAIKACCCKSQQEGEVQLPNAEKATQKMITDANGQCAICYQNFMLNQQVVRLKCSPKHMFHTFCISSWAKLKANCPICRKSIRNPEAEQNPSQ